MIYPLVCLLVVANAQDLWVEKDLEQGCKTQTDHGMLDLISAINENALYNTTSTTNQATFYWSPCADKQPSFCKSKAAIWMKAPHIGCITLAEKADSYFSVKNTSTYLIYRHSMGSSTSQILLSCTNSTSNISFTEDSNCDWSNHCFIFTHPSCCTRGINVQDAKAHSGGDFGANIGFVLLVVVTIACLCIAIAAIFMYLSKTNVSTICPFVEINRTLPHLLQEGLSDMGQRSNGQKKKRSNYEKI